jgi:hypothetical protein
MHSPNFIAGEDHFDRKVDQDQWIISTVLMSNAARVTRAFTPVRMEADLIPRPKLFAAHTVIPSGMTASVEDVI